MYVTFIVAVEAVWTLSSHLPAADSIHALLIGGTISWTLDTICNSNHALAPVIWKHPTRTFTSIIDIVFQLLHHSLSPSSPPSLPSEWVPFLCQHTCRGGYGADNSNNVVCITVRYTERILWTVTEFVFCANTGQFIHLELCHQKHWNYVIRNIGTMSSESLELCHQKHWNYVIRSIGTMSSEALELCNGDYFFSELHYFPILLMVINKHMVGINY